MRSIAQSLLGKISWWPKSSNEIDVTRQGQYASLVGMHNSLDFRAIGFKIQFRGLYCIGEDLLSWKYKKLNIKYLLGKNEETFNENFITIYYHRDCSRLNSLGSNYFVTIIYNPGIIKHYLRLLVTLTYAKKNTFHGST